MKMDKMHKELLGFVGVDSGQLMVCDPCYLKYFKDDGCDVGPAENEFSYAATCEVTTSKEQGGRVGLGVAFSSGFGDAQYPVWAVYDEIDGSEVIVGIEIPFTDY